MIRLYPTRSPGRPQRGSALIEFTIIAPVLTLLGMGVTQYALMFNAKNMVNHASFMAARAGSMGNASLGTVESTYARALIPLYGGGRSTTELAESYAKALADLKGRARFELINPTKESFDDWSDDALKAQHGGKRAIKNSGLAFRADGVVKAASGQSLQDANLIKLKITHGYELKVPFIGKATTSALALLDKGSDPFITALYAEGRIPLVNHVTLQMQSDPVEPEQAVSIAGAAKGGTPDNTGTPAQPEPQPPACTANCNEAGTPNQPAEADDEDAPDCAADGTVRAALPGDLLFEFGQPSLTDAGKQQLDELIQDANAQSFESVHLIGYTDPLGSAAVNDALSLARAQAVKDHLVNNGFPDKPITVEGRGARDVQVPLSACPSGGQAQLDCLAPNRRVELILQGVES